MSVNPDLTLLEGFGTAEEIDEALPGDRLAKFVEISNGHGIGPKISVSKDRVRQVANVASAAGMSAAPADPDPDVLVTEPDDLTA